jgi:hypothetical protein
MRIFTGILMAAALSTGAFAQGQADTESYISYVSVQPCSSWSYDSDIRGYKCNFTARHVNVPEHRDVQRLADLVDRLERKIADLEARVSRLEAQ